jgi:acyl-CoA synthetase (AMP-forming)/AMP-acid ligase II
MANSQEPAEVFGGAAFDINRPYWDLFINSASQYPHHEAVVSLWQKDWSGKDEALRWTYAELLELCENVSAWLYSQGCRAGMSVAVFLGNSAEWILFLWVAARMGLTFVPLDPSALKADGEHFVTAVSPHIVVVDDDEAAGEFDRAARHGMDKNAICISCDKGEVPGWHSLASIVAAANSGDPAHKDILPSEVDETRPERLIFFTSGTTGLPKGCPLTAAHIWSQTWDWEPPPQGSFDRWLLHTPVSHILGCNHALRMFRAAGTVVFSGKRFTVNATYPALKQERCTKMAAVPTLVRALLASESFGSQDEIALHYVTLGGTLITPEDIKLCKTGLGVKAAVQGYGLTEGMPLACWHSLDPLLAEKDGYHAGVGKVLPGANFRICEPNSMNILKRNEAGELHVSGSSVISGYLHGIEPDQFYVDGQGTRWFKT